MNYFIVFQNKTYNEEMSGGYLWAPQRTKGGKKIYHWTNMTKVKDGDIIFSMYKGNFVSVNIAKGTAVEEVRPHALDKESSWDKNGWLLEVKYNCLKNPIIKKSNIDEILKLCPNKYSPFTKSGRGNQGYLFQIGKKLGEYLLDLVKSKNDLEILKEMECKYIKEIDDIINKFKDNTEKKIIIKARVGQGLFKEKLLIKSCKCAICGLDIKRLLRASHCKPWVKSNDKERLDVNNGLLLCPNHDVLFDNGFITFQDNGDIIICKKIDKSQYKLLNINENINIKLSSEQIPYIKYHRENEFLEKVSDKIEHKEIIKYNCLTQLNNK